MDDMGDWGDFFEALEVTCNEVLGNAHYESKLDSLEGGRYFIRLVTTGALLELENHNPAYPRFTRLVSPWRQWGLPNPDFTYFHAPIHGDYQYRISGRRGTGRFLTFATHDGRTGMVAKSRQIDTAIHFDDGSGDMSIDPDGHFDIILSRDKQDGNWLELPEGEGMVSYRNCFYDWESEEPAMVTIEREGAVLPAPPYGEEDLSYRIGRLVEFIRELPPMMALAVDQAYAVEPGTIQFAPIPLEAEDAPPRDDQVYGQGVYGCGVDEAVVLEVTPPECLYWGFQLVTKNWESSDWDLRSTSINGHQAVLDADGVFRAVISHQDPGVTNWLDAGNHTTGLIAGRYRWFGGSYRSTDTVPTPRLKVVPLAEVRDYLPSDTSLISPAERSAALTRRMRAARRLNAGE
jgi:hypothetical protein